MISRMLAIIFLIVCLAGCASGMTDPAPIPPAMYYDVDFQPVFAGKILVKSPLTEVLV